MVLFEVLLIVICGFLFFWGCVCFGFYLLASAITADLPENLEPYLVKRFRRWTIMRFVIGLVMFACPLSLWFGDPWLNPVSNESVRQKITKGMTVDDVRHLLGEPATRRIFDDKSTEWEYSCDWVGSLYFDVEFNALGRVESTREWVW